MKNKNNKNAITIISIVLVVLIVALIVIFVIASSKNKKDELIDQVKQYTSINDFKTIEEVLAYFEIDIYMEINILPYTENTSNKAFYDKLIQYSASALNYQNFRIIDLKNEVTIEVFCNKESKKVKNVIINGENNYFEKHDSLLEINNMQNVTETKMNIQAEILKKLINNNWKISANDIGTKESTFEKYDIYFDEGIEIKEVGNKIFNIIFTEKYKSNIINNIKTTTSKEEIIKILGEPTFKDEYTECIGYKGKDIYFFYNSNKEISVYRIEKNNDSNEFAKIIDSYIEDKDETKFINDIKDKFTNYDKFENNSNGTILQYSLNGIAFRFQKGLSRGVQIYNN